MATAKPSKAPVKAPAKKPKPTGAPSKISPERIKTITEALALGYYIEQAAILAGITDTTCHNWIARGRRERERLEADATAKPNDTEVEFLGFLEAVEKARALAEGRHIRNITRAADSGTWQASAWFLERAMPKRWGRKQGLEISGPEGQPVRLDLDIDDLERQVVSVMEKRGL